MAYKLSDAIADAYNRKWSMINTFTMQIHLNPAVSSKLGFPFDEGINLNVVSLTTPDYTNDPIEVFVANRWVIHNGKDALYRFSATFRDEDQMLLYKKFWMWYHLSKEMYFDEVAATIKVIKDPDWAGEAPAPLFTFDGVMVESISNLSFDNNTESQIAEFSVNFKCNKPSIQ